MTERERLIELLKNNCSCINEDCKKCGCGDKCFTYREADYLLENGVIVPPCKVGDKVYYITYGRIFKSKCNAITQQEKSLYIHLYDYDGDNASISADRVFLTKEEAEKALKARCGKCHMKKHLKSLQMLYRRIK